MRSDVAFRSRSALGVVPLRPVRRAPITITAASTLGGLLLLACGGSTPKPGSPIVQATTRPGQLTVKVTGATVIDFTGTTPLQIIVADQRNIAPNLRFTSVTVAQAVKAGTVRFQGGFNLSGLGGDGRFEIGPRPASPSPGTIPSAAYLHVLSPATVRYDQPGKPCILEIHDDARNGRLECPELRSDSGKSISLTMTWATSS